MAASMHCLLSLSPTGSHLAVAQHSSVAVCDLSSGSVTLVPGHTGTVRALVFASDMQLVVAGDDKRVTVHCVSSAAQLGSTTLEKKVTGVASMPGGATVCVADRFGRIFRVATTDAAATSKASEPALAHYGVVTAMCHTSSGAYLVSADADAKVRVSHSARLHSIQSFCHGHTRAVTSLLALHGHLFVSAALDGSLRLWNADDGAELQLVDVGELADTADEADEAVAVQQMVYCSGQRLLLLTVHGCNAVFGYELTSECRLQHLGRIPLERPAVGMAVHPERPLLYLVDAAAHLSQVTLCKQPFGAETRPCPTAEALQAHIQQNASAEAKSLVDDIGVLSGRPYKKARNGHAGTDADALKADAGKADANEASA